MSAMADGSVANHHDMSLQEGVCESCYLCNGYAWALQVDLGEEVLARDEVNARSTKKKRRLRMWKISLFSVGVPSRSPNK